MAPRALPALAAAVAGAALLAPAAPAAIFGTEPLAISVAPGPVAPDG
ncbi:MAG: hypothetical protein IRZ32_17185, partial [Solirubrobacteraceae bacterium]|nr:hypothetical protein [Solirubrobacteraceae bacterium]